MRLRVQHEDGQIETITIVPPITVRYGNTLHRLVDGSHMEHWFTDDGHYDGWGSGDKDVIARLEDDTT